jgi:hypothetical protein
LIQSAHLQVDYWTSVQLVSPVVDCQNLAFLMNVLTEEISMVATRLPNKVDHGRRRSVGVIAASIGAVGTASLLSANLAPAAGRDAFRLFRINISDDKLVDLRRRIAVTRWPVRETVADRSQGVQLAKLQELVRYWGTDYDWPLRQP